MSLWDYDQKSYEENKVVYKKIEGKKLVRIDKIDDAVTPSGNDMWKIVLSVSEEKIKIYYNLVFDKAHKDITNGKLGRIFDAFSDENGTPIKQCVEKSEWIGKIAAAEIRSKTYNGNEYPEIHYFIDREQAAKLNLGKFKEYEEPTTNDNETASPQSIVKDAIDISDDDLPF